MSHLADGRPPLSERHVSERSAQSALRASILSLVCPGPVQVGSRGSKSRATGANVAPAGSGGYRPGMTDTSAHPSLPLPPVEMRRFVSPITDPAFFDNPTGQGALDQFGTFDYSAVLDFGCGCGRIARQMLQQQVPPAKYLGIDLHPEEIAWCRANLERPGFRFEHMDIQNDQFNPSGSVRQHPFPAGGDHFTLAVANSVFTHILERDVAFYLSECARALSDDGILFATWFVFDKRHFPAMQTFQNALYINPDNLNNAVWYDVEFIFDLYRKHGLTIFDIRLPAVRGHQYVLKARKGPGDHVAFPEDTAHFISDAARP